MPKNISPQANQKTLPREKVSVNPNCTDSDTPMREEIIASWQRCQASRVDAHCTLLPDIKLPPPSVKIFREKQEGFREIGESCRKVFDLLLHDSQVAVFYTDLDLNIVMQYGNEHLLQRLNSINLVIGANLSEDVIGTNAIAISHQTKQTSSVAGSEHYLDVLKSYASKASPLWLADNVPVAFLMYVVDLNNFDPALSIKLDQLIDLQNHMIGMEINNLELSLQNLLPDLDLDARESGTIFLDSHGLIIQVSKWLSDYWEFNKEDILGRNLAKVFPELSEAVTHLPSGQSMPVREIFFHNPYGKDSKLVMQCRWSKKPGRYSGMLIALSENKSATKTSGKKPLHDAHFTFKDLIGISPSFIEAKNIAEVASVSNCNVMIIGESGSGKELFAQSIHNNSSRSREPFISINCAAIPKELIYSELFGYVEGAFTGAKKGGSPGKFELANKGTLFLDEIAEIPNEMQAVLLRVLEDDSVSRLGSSVSIPIDVRVIAATNRDICRSVATSDFRLDLYHRLCTVRIDISPLRRRKEDIPVLADYFLRLFNFKHNKEINRITPQAMQFMQDCLWLGNVRELRNVIERGVIFCAGPEIGIIDLPKELMKHHKGTRYEMPAASIVGDSTIQKLFQEKMDEKYKIEFLLNKYNHNKTLVAQDLGITRATLYRKLKFLGFS